MDFRLTEEQTLIRDTARDFATAELQPAAAELDSGRHEQVFSDNLLKLAELGFMGLNVSEKYGGCEAGPIAYSLAITELARGCASTAVTVSVSNMVNEVIQALGTEEQKSRYIPKICSGEFKAGAFCLTESGAGSDPAGLSLKAVRDGEKWVLNGSKIFVTSGSLAGVLLVWAVTDPDAPKGKGISVFLIEKGTPGLCVGKAEDKMGQHGSPTNEIQFENCVLPGEALLGRENDGFRIAVSELAGGRIGIGSLALGIGLEAMDRAVRYSLERKQFGKAISAFEAIQWKIADAYTDLEAASLLLLQAAWKKEQGESFARAASMAKLFATEAANRACYEAMQIFGGYGYTKEFGIERLARDVRVTTIYEGTSEVQRLIIARDILKSFS